MCLRSLPALNMLSTALLVLGVVVTSLPRNGAHLTLNILHTNDFRSQYEEFNGNNGHCSTRDCHKNQCFGGIARLATAVKEARAQLPNTLLLDAGNQFQAQNSLLFVLYRWDIVQYFMVLLGYDAMALGNQEFDNQLSGLAPFLKSVDFGVVSANIDSSNEPLIECLFTKSVRRTVAGRKVGIVGYTLDSRNISQPGRNLQFDDIVSSVQAEVQRLQETGVDIIIALGHAGFDVDKQVADIPGVDVVIGGHTSTFLYTGDPPSSEVPEGPYPFVTNQSSGQTVVVAQCFTMGKYLCRLEVTFNDDGDVISFGGNPILLDTNVTPDPPTVVELSDPWQAGVANLSRTVVGRSLVRLEGDFEVCSVRECNLGNLLADSMVFKNLGNADEFSWNDVSISIVNSGAIRSSLDRGNISLADALTTVVFGDTFDAITIKGKYLRAALEYSVSQLDPCVKPERPFLGFLQVSGLRVKYNLRKPVGHRVVSVDALCTRCLVPAFQPLQDEQVYKVIIGAFIADGGRGFSVIADNIIEYFNLGDVDADVFTEYIRAQPAIYTAVEGRIQFVDRSDECHSPPSKSSYHSHGVEQGYRRH